MVRRGSAPAPRHLPGQARRPRQGRRGARRGGQGLRKVAGRGRPHRVLRRPPLLRRHLRHRARQILWRHPIEDHRAFDRPRVLRAGAESDRRRGSRCRAQAPRSRPLRAVVRGLAQREEVSARRAARKTLCRKGRDVALGLGPPVQRDDDGAAFRGRGRTETAEPRADAQLHDASQCREAQSRGRRTVEGVSGKHPPLHADHQYARQGQGNLGSLARLRRCRGFAPSRQPRRARGRRCAGCGCSRGLSADRASLLRDEGAVARHGQARALGPQRATPRKARARFHLEGSRAHRARCLRRLRPGHGEDRAALLHKGWIDAPVREGKAPAHSRIRRRRRRIPTSCSITRASRAT